ncbi:hypothetical protein E4U55_001758 [Claviceps digitariae]|nr:hypothetical protein E4U55_001758 [Claviceps digitariae]
MTPSPAALTIYTFGLTCLLAGTYNLWQSLQHASACQIADTGNALAAIAMGLYYPLAAYQANRLFFKATVPMRILTTVVFWRLGQHSVAMWEGCGALATALALLAEG